MRDRWPLLGRDDEFQLLVERLLGADRQHVVLAGQAGVGKSRLGAELLSEAEDRGLAVVRVTCGKSMKWVALGAFVSLLPVEEHHHASDRAVLMQAAAAITSRARSGCIIVMIDDAHELDDASAALTQILADDDRVALLITVRTGEHCPDAVLRLWKDEDAIRLELQSLSKTETYQLVSHVLDHPVDDAALEWFWQLSAGNPLYLRELISGALDTEAVVSDEGLWRLSDGRKLPGRLVELIAQRLGALGRSEKVALELLAFSGGLGLSELEDRVGRRAIEHLEEAALINVERDGRRRPVRLAHPLYEEVVRERAPAARAAAVQRSLADLIERKGLRRRTDVVAAALLRLEADGTASPDLLTEAARRAYSSLDAPLTKRFLQAAVAAGAGHSARRLLGEILWWMGEYDEAEQILSTVDADELPSEVERVLHAVTRANNLFRGAGRHADAVAVLLDAETSTTRPDHLGELRANRAQFDLFAGDLPGALALAEPVLKRGSGRAFVQAAVVSAFGYTMGGRTEDAIALADRAYAECQRLEGQDMLTTAGVFVTIRCQALTEGGRLSEAEQLTRASYEWSVASGLLLGQAWFGMMLGGVHLRAGRLQRAESFLAQAALAFRDLHDPGIQRWCVAAVALARASRGDIAGARSAFANAEGLRASPMTAMDGFVDQVAAWVAAMGGEHTRAKVILLDTAERARATRGFALEASCLHDLIRLGVGQVAARLSELSTIVQGPLMPIRAEHASALAARDGDALVSSSQAFERIGASLLAAEAAAQAARAYRQRGHLRAARSCAARAGELAAVCEGACTPALGLADEAAPLTPREQEVAALASAGLTSPEIAARLVLSERTVENHLQRVYDKLGVASRGDLADRLGTAPVRQ